METNDDSRAANLRHLRDPRTGAGRCRSARIGRLHLVERGEEVAELVPVANPALAAVRSRLRPGSATARTAGVLRGESPFPGIDEEHERAQAAAGVSAARTARRRARESVVERTAGALSRYRLTPPLTIEQENEAFAWAVAEENAPDRSE
jgi:hypothetical protein